MTKKEQNALLREALNRMHFHRTITQDPEQESKVVDKLMAFAEKLRVAERVEETDGSTKEQVNAAFDAAYNELVGA